MHKESARLQFAVPAEEETRRELARFDTILARHKTNLIVLGSVLVAGFLLLEANQLQWLLHSVIVGTLVLDVIAKRELEKPRA